MRKLNICFMVLVYFSKTSLFSAIRSRLLPSLNFNIRKQHTNSHKRYTWCLNKIVSHHGAENKKIILGPIMWYNLFQSPCISCVVLVYTRALLSDTEFVHHDNYYLVWSMGGDCRTYGDTHMQWRLFFSKLTKPQHRHVSLYNIERQSERWEF